MIKINVFFVISSIFLCLFDPINSSLLTQYEGLEKDYWKWKETFGEKKGIIERLSGGYMSGFSIFQKNPNPTNIVPEYDESRKKELCDEFVESHNYLYVEARMQKLIKKSKVTKTHLKNSAEFNSQDEARDVIIGSQKDTLKMFQCVADKEDKHVFHLTFGPPKDYVFVISTAKKEAGETKPIFQALLQPSGTIDKELMKKMEKLHLLFWKKLVQINTRLQEPIRKSLCAIDEYQHFNLCSVVADKLYRDLKFNEMKIEALNYIHKIPERCVLKTIVDSRGKMGDTEEDVLSCVLNTNDWSKPHFFLLRDTLSNDLPASVFVLTPNKENKDSLTLLTRIDNVMVLTMP